MKRKITSCNFKIDVFKGFLVGIILFGFLDSFAQSANPIIVSSVSPTRVTTQSRVSVISAPGTFSTPTSNYIVTAGGISIGVPEDDPSGTELVFRITRDETNYQVTDNYDLSNQALMINGETVHTDDGQGPSSANQVFLEYVAPQYEDFTINKSFFVKEIYTNWDYNGNGFWSSRDYVQASNKATASPNDKHELLGYKVNNGTNDIIYSTGVNDSLLEAKLVHDNFLTSQQITDGLVYKRNVFKAYTTNGVHGTTDSGNFIIAGDMIDGMDNSPPPPQVSQENFTQEQFDAITEIKDLTILEAITNGKNGLELGIGVTNFNSTVEVQFFSGNGQPGAVGDEGTPDLLITQIADAQSGQDIYYYAGESGDVIGRPIRLRIQDNPTTELTKWKMNLYTFPTGQSFATANPNARLDKWLENKFRPLRIAAFKLEDFEITTEGQVDLINTINMNAGGTADMAFMAYNAASFDIQGPVAKTILPQYICQVNGDGSVTFQVVPGVNAGIEDFTNPIGIRAPLPNQTPDEEFEYQLWKGGVQILPIPIMGTEAWLTDPNDLRVDNIDYSELGTYKIRIANGQGTVFVPVEIIEGGVPHIWDGSSWSAHSDYGLVSEANRNLFFAADYNQTVNLLEGCDCYVAPGKNVTILEGKTMKLYGAITVADEVLEDEDNQVSGAPAGTFTLKNNASLIQTKEVTANENSGDIIVERIAETIHKYDYVYWSSPVNNGDLSMIPGVTSHVYEWDVNATDGKLGTLGNWVGKTGVMKNGRGYIKRVNEPTTTEAEFEGVPNNGPITIDVVKTGGAGSGMAFEDKHLNLVGNPYPSSLSADTFLYENSSLEGFVLIWSHDTSIFNTNAGSPFYEDFRYNYGDQYFKYNYLGPSDPNGFNGYIASGQGFFVKVKESATSPLTVVFNNNMRYDSGENAYDNSQFYRGSAMPPGSDIQAEKQLIWLSLVNESNVSANTLVGYAEGATNGMDRLYDANSGSGDMRLYSILDDSDLIIQGRALPFQDSDRVPLGVELLKNGIYKIGIGQLKGSLMLNEDQGIYLEDTYNNIIHDLKNAPYSFTAEAGDIKDRFVLRYTNETLSVDDKQMSNTFVYIKNDQLYVKASKNIESVLVYDLTGKKLMDYKLDGHTDRFNAQFQFPKGAYLTLIKTEDARTVTKKVMN